MLKPHLDPHDKTRAALDFDPLTTNYRKLLVEDWIDAASSFLDSSGNQGAPPIVFFLGSELDRSLASHPKGWIALLALARARVAERGLADRFQFTHDLLWTFGGRTNLDASAATYLAMLDSISLSQYTELDRFGATPEAGSKALKENEDELRHFLKNAGITDVQKIVINVGEFGIGSGGLKNPWYYSTDSRRNEDATVVGVKSFLHFFEAVPSSNRRLDWAILWTVNEQYDIFANHQWRGDLRTERSPAADLIEAYNRLHERDM